jgi:hypothetical protein
MTRRENYIAAIVSMLHEHKEMVSSSCDTIWAEYQLRSDGKVDFQTDKYEVTLTVNQLAEMFWHDAEQYISSD